MPALADRVLNTIRKYDLAGEGTRVLVGLSGGPDSVALLHLLLELEARAGFVVVGAAHFHHGLRGLAADEDAQFCQALLEQLGRPMDMGRADVGQLAEDTGQSIENAGRTARYAFLSAAAARVGADRIAVGHTRDDQAETFLLKLIRGAGPAGLAAIYPRKGALIRPLLETSRHDVEQYLAERKIVACQDATNFNLSNPRNRVRHEIIPQLEARFSSGIRQVLARNADIAREDDEWLNRAADLAASNVQSSTQPGVTILDAAALAALPQALARRVVRRALLETGLSGSVEFRHVETVLAMARDASAPPADLPGQRAVRLQNRVVLTARGPNEPGRGPKGPAASTESNSFQYLLSIPGEVLIDRLGLRISAEPGDLGRDPECLPTAERVAIDGPLVALPLTIRTRRPGDAFRPAGMKGRKKLQDYFVDRKIAREVRDFVPLVTDARGRIVWVVGQVLADDFRVTDRTQGVIILTAKQLGGIG